MDNYDIYSTATTQRTETKSRGKKRKWREIEAIHEEYRLRKELADIDFALDLELEKLD